MQKILFFVSKEGDWVLCRQRIACDNNLRSVNGALCRGLLRPQLGVEPAGRGSLADLVALFFGVKIIWPESEKCSKWHQTSRNAKNAKVGKNYRGESFWGKTPESQKGAKWCETPKIPKDARAKQVRHALHADAFHRRLGTIPWSDQCQAISGSNQC